MYGFSDASEQDPEDLYRQNYGVPGRGQFQPQDAPAGTNGPQAQWTPQAPMARPAGPTHLGWWGQTPAGSASGSGPGRRGRC